MLGCRGLLFAASSGDGDHLPGHEGLSPPGLPVLSPEEIWLLFSSASISDSEGLGGCFARHCALLQFRHWFPGQLLMLLRWDMGNVN